MVSNLPYYSGKEINLRKSVPFITVLLLALFFFVLNSKSTTCCAFLCVYALRIIWLYYVDITVEKKEKIY